MVNCELWEAVVIFISEMLTLSHLELKGQSQIDMKFLAALSENKFDSCLVSI